MQVRTVEQLQNLPEGTRVTEGETQWVRESDQMKATDSGITVSFNAFRAAIEDGRVSVFDGTPPAVGMWLSRPRYHDYVLSRRHGGGLVAVFDNNENLVELTRFSGGSPYTPARGPLKEKIAEQALEIRNLQERIDLGLPEPQERTVVVEVTCSSTVTLPPEVVSGALSVEGAQAQPVTTEVAWTKEVRVSVTGVGECVCDLATEEKIKEVIGETAIQAVKYLAC